MIDNAEKIAGNLPKYATNLSLSCYPDEKDQAIYINVSYDFIPEKFIEMVRSVDGSDECKED